MRAQHRLVAPAGSASAEVGASRTILQIAGVRFRHGGEDLAHTVPAHYAPFLNDVAHDGDVQGIEVQTVTTAHPPVAARDLFRAEGAWSIGRDGGDYLLALDPGGVGTPPLASVRFAPGLEIVTISAPERPLRHLAYPVDQLLLMYVLARGGGVMLHAAGVGIEGRGFAFCGRSGAGKTTLSQQIAAVPGFVPLSDDRVVVRPAPGGHAVYGTPWPGEGRIAVNSSFPLAGLIFLARGPEHRLVRLSPGDALARILPVAAVPWFDPGPLAPQLDFCGTLVERVPCWELAFQPLPSLAEFLKEHLAEQCSR